MTSTQSDRKAIVRARYDPFSSIREHFPIPMFWGVADYSPIPQARLEEDCFRVGVGGVPDAPPTPPMGGGLGIGVPGIGVPTRIEESWSDEEKEPGVVPFTSTVTVLYATPEELDFVTTTLIVSKMQNVPNGGNHLRTEFSQSLSAGQSTANIKGIAKLALEDSTNGYRVAYLIQCVNQKPWDNEPKTWFLLAETGQSAELKERGAVWQIMADEKDFTPLPDEGKGYHVDTPSPSNELFDTLRIWWGDRELTHDYCLAGSCPVRLADGSCCAASELKVGDHVMSDCPGGVDVVEACVQSVLDRTVPMVFFTAQSVATVETVETVATGPTDALKGPRAQVCLTPGHPVAATSASAAWKKAMQHVEARTELIHMPAVYNFVLGHRGSLFLQSESGLDVDVVEGMGVVQSLKQGPHVQVSTLGQFCAGVDDRLDNGGQSWFGSEAVVTALKRLPSWPNVSFSGRRGLSSLA